MRRTFLHVDMDAFYASIEQRDHPEWRGQPVVVGAPPDQRGVVSAASYEARTFGIHSAMPSSEAGKRCPHAIFLPVDMQRYRTVSRRIFDIFERFTPLVEPLSVDEAFLDVSGAERLFGDGPEIARRIKQTIREELKLTASVGVAPNKFLAKLASDLDKPDGLTLVPRRPNEIQAFLAPLPVGYIWGVGKVTRRHLEQAGIRTIGDLQHCRRHRLEHLLGAHAADHLQRLARGEDTRNIEPDYNEKSISREFTFLEDCTDHREIESVLCDLVDDVGRRLRRREKYAATAHLKLRWKGFQTITRQRSLSRACCDDFALREIALELLGAQDLSKPIRLVGFGVSNLRVRQQEQLLLFDGQAAQQRRETLSHTMDRIREDYGPDSIRREHL